MQSLYIDMTGLGNKAEEIDCYLRSISCKDDRLMYVGSSVSLGVIGGVEKFQRKTHLCYRSNVSPTEIIILLMKQFPGIDFQTEIVG